MKKFQVAAVSAVTCGALAFGSTPASATGSGDSAGSKPTYTATAAFAKAAKAPASGSKVKPQAIPAVVATAFVAGAAYGAGKVVAGWAAKKVIGRSSVSPRLSLAQLD